MAVWSTGSVATHVGNLIGWTNISTISGTTLSDVVEQQVNFVNTYTSDNISSSSISEKYQPVIIDLTMSQVLISMDAQEGGTESVSLGELSVNQGGAGGNASLAKQLKDSAISKLKELGRALRYRRVIGG